jgi:hypothetical protein
VAAPELTEFKPARPPAIKLADEKFSLCGKMVCMTAAAAQRALQNKVDMYSWMVGADAVMDYYEGRSAPPVGEPTVTAPVAAKRHKWFSKKQVSK